MKEKLYEFIKTNRRAVFTEIEHFFQDSGYAYEGNVAFFAREGSNILLWNGWSQEACNLLVELTEEGEICWSPASPIECYLMTSLLQLPLAVQIQHNYKEPHWLPAVIDIHEKGR